MWGVDGSSLFRRKRKPSSVLVQIEQKQTGGMKLDDKKTKNKTRTQALFFLGGSLGDDVVSSSR